MQLQKLYDRAVKFSTVTALGLITIAPLIGTGAAAQADPPDWAPAHGYRNKDKKGNKGNKDKGNRKHGGRHGERGDRHRDRDDDWDDRDDRDDHDWDDDNNDNDNDFRSVDFAGTVVSVQSRYRITVRSDSGRVYTVNSRTQISSAISNGDRVRVIGSADDNFVRADRVTLVRDNNNGTQQGQAVNFRGTVISVNNNTDTLRVRGDNGRTYIVRYRNADNFDVGDRVRVRGTFRYGVVTASSVTSA